MSHNDYTKYARENQVKTPEPETVAPVVEHVMAAEVEPEIAPVVEAPVIDAPVVESEPDVETVHHIGHVVGCTRLNVRKAPKPRAEIICEINCGDKVEIDKDQSTVDFYKICTVSGIEGYCVKTYILEK